LAWEEAKDKTGFVDTQFLGNRQVVWNGTLIVPDGESARVETQLGGWPLKIVIFCYPNAKSSEITWSGKENALELSFKGWTNSLLTGVRTAQKLGQTNDGRAFGFIATAQRAGQLTKIDFQILWGGSYG
jgi:hypothetical protein